MSPAASRTRAVLLLLVLCLAFWWLRVIGGTGSSPQIPINAIDAFKEFTPRMAMAFGTLAEGRLPLWNPHQLAGMPMLAVAFTGVFYPPNWIFTFLPPHVGMEVSIVIHMLLGAGGMLLLTGALGLSTWAGLAAAATFTWGGFAFLTTYQPVLFAQLMWAPTTLLLLLRVVEGRRHAWPVLAAAVALQLFLGATEIFLHVFQAGALFTFVWLVVEARNDTRGALSRAAWVLSALAVGTGLAAVQLLPTFELVGLSTRAPGELDLADVTARGMLPLVAILDGLLGDGEPPTAIGLLPLLGLPLALGVKRAGPLLAYGAVLMIGATLLVTGGELFRLYTELPFGTLFRRPSKFLDLALLGAALLAGLAVQGLEVRVGLTRRELWRSPAWLVTVVLGALGLAWATRDGLPGAPLLLGVAALLGFGLSGTTEARGNWVVALVAAHAALLFFATPDRGLRPWHAPDLVHQQDALWEEVGRRLGHQRAYVSEYGFDPPLAVTQGTLQGVDVVLDFQPLALRDYRDFFQRAVGFDEERVFWGVYRVTAKTHWRMLDLASTRLYLMRSQQVARGVNMTFRRGFRPLALPSETVFAFDRPSAMPRAYWVGSARVIEDPETRLDALASRRFPANRRVVLNAPVEKPREGRLRFAPSLGRARITRYEAERVRIDVAATRPGFLVLTDVDYPGWEARVDGERVPIHRANHLFRAVQVPAGRHEVGFDYRPASLKWGALASVGALVLAFAGGLAWRRALRIAKL